MQNSSDDLEIFHQLSRDLKNIDELKLVYEEIKKMFIKKEDMSEEEAENCTLIMLSFSYFGKIQQTEDEMYLNVETLKAILSVSKN